MKRTCLTPHINASGRLTDFYKNLISLALCLSGNAGDIAEVKSFGIPLHRGRIAESANAAQFFHVPETPEARMFITGDLLV